MPDHQADMADLAVRFINSTASHIFLTGKAGTGKTTLLLELASKTHKPFVVVAPTGIAALNAGGVTIHSQFLLPLGSFIPERDPSFTITDGAGFYTRQTLARRHPLNKVRKQVLRAIDLLVIDEVSMLRADVLDAIDYRMRSVKGNFRRSFGGAQVLMIGDLYQLPPIVKDGEWAVLQQYYKSMHFFEARALKEDGLVYVELDKIYRQEDAAFIEILNNLRNNVVSKRDIETLNGYYRPGDGDEEDRGVITITTHNYKADTINSRNLESLPGDPTVCEADVSGDFPEHLFPLPQKIELKEGARVMFVRNDSSGEGAYYNGKLARVHRIEDEEVEVLMDDSGDAFTLRRERWENKKYTVDEDSAEVDDEVVGTFEQYPVKLAWAVTVHKSQGLTFDRAVIDVGSAFAPGQVYVALSRLRSLDGLVLRTRINTSSISSDHDVVTFTRNNAPTDSLSGILREKQREFVRQILDETFDFSHIEKQFVYFRKSKSGSMEFEEESMRHAMDKIERRFGEEKKNTATYRRQLHGLLRRGDSDLLMERLEKGSAYYARFIEETLGLLLGHMAEVERYTRTRTYLNALGEIDQLLMKTWEQIDKASHLTKCILNGEDFGVGAQDSSKRAERRKALLKQARERADENPALSSRRSGRRRKKRQPGETYEVTYAMLREGLGIDEVAKKRGLATGTIEGHIARGIAKGRLRIYDMMSEDVVEEIADKIRESDGSLGAAHNALAGKYTYGVLRMVRAHLDGER